MMTYTSAGNDAGRTDCQSACYLGRICSDETVSVAVIREGGGVTGSPLPFRLDLRNHSPTGFAWGYAGSGPSQLALAILADAVGDNLAVSHYQDFKWAFITPLERDQPWEITLEQIREWMAQRPGMIGECP